MRTTMPELPLSFRQEVVAPLFQLLSAGESCAIIGPASVGKSNLLHFILRPDVQQRYLGDRAITTLLLVADGNRLAELSEWGLYELLLTTLTEAVGQHPEARHLRGELNALRREVIVSRDAVLARRHVELAAHILCREQGLNLCFILDEFDECYQAVSNLALANLRALRDANKYHLCYVLMLRDHPGRLRSPDDCENFYELFCRSLLGLGPCRPADAERVMERLETRKGELPPTTRGRLMELSGGHPGLMVALFDVALRGNPPAGDWTAWALAQPTIREECQKLWGGLADDERLALSHIVRRIPVADDLYDLLTLKGLTRADQDQTKLFSPLFAHFVLTEARPSDEELRVDEAANLVWVGDQPITTLSAREFDLLALLYRHAGHVCTRDQILAHLYPGEAFDAQDNRVDVLVKRVRAKIEPQRDHPIYLLTVRGKGYKLATGTNGAR